MIEQEKIKRMIKRINGWEYEGGTPFTVLPPSYGEPYLLRVYGFGGLLVKIRYGNYNKRFRDIYMMDKKYSTHLGKERDGLVTYITLAEENSSYAIKLFGGENDCEIDNQFMKLAAEAMKKKWTKNKSAPKTQLLKERNIQASIVSNYMRNNIKWKVIAQEVQFKKKWFSEGDFTDRTTETERFDLIVMSEKGLGFVELKVNNENYQNLNSHYEHMQFVRTHPQKFVEEIDKRFDLIKEYGLWQEDEYQKYDNKNIWFGFLFVNGGLEKCKSIVETYFVDKQHNNDETYYMYYEGDIENLDINNMMSYEDFIAYKSN